MCAPGTEELGGTWDGCRTAGLQDLQDCRIAGFAELRLPTDGPHAAGSAGVRNIAVFVGNEGSVSCQQGSG